MAPDALAPMSLSTAQLIENAIEEEQYSYAVECMTMAAKLGVHPTRDLFLALLAIVYSQVDYHTSEADRQQRKRRHMRAEFETTRRMRRLDQNDPRDIENDTVCAAMMLLDTLIRDAPNAVCAFLPSRTEAAEQEGAEKVYEGVEEREWLRNASDNDRSTGNARSRSTSISTTPIMQIALRMRECKNVWQLLTIDLDQDGGDDDEDDDGATPRKFALAGPRTTSARRKALEARRAGDGNSIEHERRNMAQYDRPGTWMVMEFLNDLWTRELYQLERQAQPASRWWSTHLALQFTRLDWKKPKQFAVTEMDEAFDLIRAGFLAQEEGHTTRLAKRDTHAFVLLKLLAQLVAQGVLDEGVFLRKCSDHVLAADGHVLSYPIDQGGADIVLVKAVARYLKPPPTPWNKEVGPIGAMYTACMALPAMPATTRTLLEAIASNILWATHRQNYEKEEVKERNRLVKESDEDIKGRDVEMVLSDLGWQLFGSHSRQTKRKRDDDELTSRAVSAQCIAASVRLRAIDCIHARMGAQSFLLATITQAARDTALQPEVRQHISTLASSLGDRLLESFKINAAAIEACYGGILEACFRAQRARRAQWQDVLDEWAAVLQKIQRRSSEAQVAYDLLAASLGK